MPVIQPAPADQAGITEVEAGLLGASVNQASHGFAVGDIIRNNNGTWAKAQADSAANAGSGEQLAVVDTVTDVNNFTPRYGGKLTLSSHGYTEGDEVYLDASTAGARTTTAPSTAGQVVIKVGSAYDADTLLIDIDGGYVVE